METGVVTAAVSDSDADLSVANPPFDVPPASAIDRVVTERDPLDTGDVAAVADESRALRDWPEERRLAWWRPQAVRPCCSSSTAFARVSGAACSRLAASCSLCPGSGARCDGDDCHDEPAPRGDGRDVSTAEATFIADVLIGVTATRLRHRPGVCLVARGLSGGQALSTGSRQQTW